MSEKTNEYLLGRTVYHTEIYNGTEPMKVVGVKDGEVELEGDYSGGTHAVRQKGWMPVKGLIVPPIWGSAL